MATDTAWTCSFCGTSLYIFQKRKTSEGYICTKCLSLCDPETQYLILNSPKKVSHEQIEREILQYRQGEKELAEFKATQKIGRYLEIDDNSRKWLVPAPKNRIPKVYSYDDIVKFELLEDRSLKSRYGSAFGAGVIFFLIGAFIGVGVFISLLAGAIATITFAATHKPVINSLRIKITTNDLNNPAVYVDFITRSVSPKSDEYITMSRYAQRTMSALEVIKTKIETENAEKQPAEGDAEYIYCKKCGNKMTVADYNFCNKCGEKVS